MSYEDEDDYEDDEMFETTKEAAAKNPAAEAIANLMQHFVGFPEDALRSIAALTVKNLASTMEQAVRNELATIVKTEAGPIVRQLIGKHLESTLAEVLGKRIVKNAQSWSSATISIEDVVKQELELAVSAIKHEGAKSNFVKTAIESFLAEELQSIAKQAVADFKKDVVADLQKGAAKEVVRAVASALSKDKKLLELLA